MNDDENKKKWILYSPHLIPKVSVVDPALQFDLPWHMVADGLVDAIMQVLEVMTNVEDPEAAAASFMLDAAMIKYIIALGNRIKEHREDYDARAIWCYLAPHISSSQMASRYSNWFKTV